MALLRSLASGAVGALTLTAIHEAARRRVSYAPRMDVLGMRALRQVVPGLQHERPRSSRLRRLALAGDLAANTLYYSAIPARDAAKTWSRAEPSAATAANAIDAITITQRRRSIHEAYRLATSAPIFTQAPCPALPALSSHAPGRNGTPPPRRDCAGA